MERNTNLVPLSRLRSRIVYLKTKLGILKEVEDVGYSNLGFKKYYVVVLDPHTNRRKMIHFGDKNYEDYLVHRDKERRRKYRLRHEGDKINEISPGRYSWYILWG